jgi:restriction system protein
VTHLPNRNIHVQQSGWLHEQAPFPYAAITAVMRRQQQVIVAPLLPVGDEAPHVLLPPLLLPTILEFGDTVQEGVLVRAVGFAWLEFVAAMLHDPRIMYDVDPRKLEELIAGGWKRAGADEVILTPRSGDGGKDVIATFAKAGRVRLFDQVKRYAPDHLVTAEEVRTMLGVLHIEGNVSKVFVTTTSEFAPGIARDDGIQRYIPGKLELRPRGVLLPWIEELAAKGVPPAS